MSLRDDEVRALAEAVLNTRGFGMHAAMDGIRPVVERIVQRYQDRATAANVLLRDYGRLMQMHAGENHG